jgi:Ca2+-binding RTX toxin-like protein
MTPDATTQQLYEAGLMDQDSIEFGAGLTPDEVSVYWSDENHVHLKWGEGKELTAQMSAYTDGFIGQGIELVKFDDGTEWTVSKLQEMATPVVSTQNDDFILSGGQSNVINGLDGNDTLLGGSGNDVLNGDAGDDYMEGRAGNDILSGGIGADDLEDWSGHNAIDGGDGDDYLYGGDYLTPGNGLDSINFMTGGRGNDYIGSRGVNNIIAFNLGDGADTIWATHALTISLGGGVSPNEFSFTRDGDDLVLKISSDDSLRWYGIFAPDDISGQTNRPAITLQVIGQDVRIYDFNAVLMDFEAAVAHGADLSNWSIGSSMTAHLLSISNDHAIGGDLAYQYAKESSIASLSSDAVRAVLSDADFGANQLITVHSASVITGSAGDDQLQDTGHVDTLAGGLGNDTYFVNNTSDIVIENANEGADTIQTSVSYVLPANVENLSGTGTADLTLTGNDLNNVITANSDNDTLIAGAGLATLNGGTGNDTFIINSMSDVIHAQAGGTNTVQTSVSLFALPANVQTVIGTGNASLILNGNSGNNLIQGNSSFDMLIAGSGTAVMQSGAGGGMMYEATGQGALLGASGNDIFYAGNANDFIAGGAGNDTVSLIATGSNVGAQFNSVVAFNSGDGQDTVGATTNGAATLSLGGGIDLNNLTLSQSGSNLILQTGGTDSITLQGWYNGASYHGFVTLQVIEQASASYDPTSSNLLINQKVDEFDFAQLVTAFDQARAADSTLTSWNVMNGLLDAHLSGSDTAAIGGDLAYNYGTKGNVTGLDFAAAIATLQDPQFGKAAQATHEWGTISQGGSALR